MPWLAGIPRSEVNWHPTIDAERCVKCGMCMNCGKAVFEWTMEGAKIVRPNDCVVGCSTCANLCQGKCISFPSIDEVRRLYKEHGIWKKVKEALKAEGKIAQEEK